MNQNQIREENDQGVGGEDNHLCPSIRFPGFRGRSLEFGWQSAKITSPSTKFPRRCGRFLHPCTWKETMLGGCKCTR
jgi:hypothetical protein